MNPPSDGNLAGAGFIAAMRRVGSRLRHHGPAWLVRRLVHEVEQPVSVPGRSINLMLRKASGLRRRLTGSRPVVAPSDSLLAVYDTRVDPVTFDVLWFLIAAECQRRRAGLKALHVVFAFSDARADAEKDHSHDGYRGVVSWSAQLDRIVNVLVPLARAVPSVNGIEILGNPAHVRARLSTWPSERIFPRDFSVDLRFQYIFDYVRALHRLRPGEADSVFRASDAARSYVDRWLEVRGGGRPVIAITLRHYRFMPARNSNLSAWAQTARYLRDRGYFPVFVPDTESLAEQTPDELAEFEHLREAAWNLNLRIALQQRAFLNLGVNNGPSHLFTADSQARGIMFKMITPGVPQAEAAFIARQGFTVGGQLPFATPFQKWVWEDDDFEVIKREFEAMEQALHAHGRATAMHTP